MSHFLHSELEWCGQQKQCLTWVIARVGPPSFFLLWTLLLPFAGFCIPTIHFFVWPPYPGPPDPAHLSHDASPTCSHAPAFRDQSQVTNELHPFCIFDWTIVITPVNDAKLPFSDILITGFPSHLSLAVQWVTNHWGTHHGGKYHSQVIILTAQSLCVCVCLRDS